MQRSSLAQFSIDFNAFKRAFRRKLKTFLPEEKGRLERLSKATVQAFVYDVYDPVEYIRTGNLKESIRAYHPDESNTKVLYIDSNPAVAPALLAGPSKGYAPYVAGEGPGIGFLAMSIPSEFPRQFHEGIFINVSSEVFHRFQTKIDKVLAMI